MKIFVDDKLVQFADVEYIYREHPVTIGMVSFMMSMHSDDCDCEIHLMSPYRTEKRTEAIQSLVELFKSEGIDEYDTNNPNAN